MPATCFFDALTHRPQGYTSFLSHDSRAPLQYLLFSLAFYIPVHTAGSWLMDLLLWPSFHLS